MIRYSTAIYKIGINPVTDPPGGVLSELFEQAGRSNGPIPVRGRLNGAEFVQTLVKYQGSWRLYINGPMLKASGLGVGDLAEIEIEFDPRPREVPMPEKLAEALKNDAKALSEFEKLRPSRQREIKKYLGSLKTDLSLTRNVERVIRILRGDDEPSDHLLTRKKT